MFSNFKLLLLQFVCQCWPRMMGQRRRISIRDNIIIDTRTKPFCCCNCLLELCFFGRCPTNCYMNIGHPALKTLTFLSPFQSTSTCIHLIEVWQILVYFSDQLLLICWISGKCNRTSGRIPDTKKGWIFCYTLVFLGLKLLYQSLSLNHQNFL